MSTRNWEQPPDDLAQEVAAHVAVDCGWGRLIFGQTFDDREALLEVMLQEEDQRRDIALYLRDPHVLVSLAPDELFIDPSYTYRLWFHRYRPAREPIRGVVVRKMQTEEDAEATNRIYHRNHMVPADPETMWSNQLTPTFTYLVAEDGDSGEVIGTVTGVDHPFAFNDPEGGSSLWCLAVDPQAQKPGVGEALVRTLAERFQARARSYMDLSVMHDNTAAIRLYEKLGFERVPVFCVKRKNPINEPLFTPAPPDEELNPYAQLIVDEARRRGITVRVIDAEGGFFALAHGGREVVTRESLSEMTTAVAMSYCDDKRVTRRLLEQSGLTVPRGRLASGDDGDASFLDRVGEVVVKPARGEQGRGVTVGVRDAETLRHAVAEAWGHCPEALLEECIEGEDLRIVVIDHEVVAAAVRRPAQVVGTGSRPIRELVDKQSRRRAAATGGEARIPLDVHTAQVVADAGYALDDVLAEGETLQVRRTANLHTGGTIHDVTAQLHPDLAQAAVHASRTLDIPVVGLDFLVPAVDGPEYVIIEANERPGLANHEPQPTAQRFIDLLFPQTRQVERS
ncbi:N-acetylglutaminylglutamine synthetase [Egibacter rhizosphaerae]|uniref:N-acetylglutaminylglutamine synthetase n=1 Tax=Egibacter rhizosphaerae TaxID=1670831 RepID=UPI003B834948